MEETTAVSGLASRRVCHQGESSTRRTGKDADHLKVTVQELCTRNEVTHSSVRFHDAGKSEASRTPTHLVDHVPQHAVERLVCHALGCSARRACGSSAPQSAWSCVHGAPCKENRKAKRTWIVPPASTQVVQSPRARLGKRLVRVRQALESGRCWRVEGELAVTARERWSAGGARQ